MRLAKIVIENTLTGEIRTRTRELNEETFYSLLSKVDIEEGDYILRDVIELY